MIDAVAQVIDLRIQTTMITAEQALTRDTVAVGVDAIVFWQVENAETAAIRIANYREAIERVAQTSLREMIGATDLSKLLSDRKTADEQLRVTITAQDQHLGRHRQQRRDQGRVDPARTAGRDEPAGAGGAGEGCARDAGLGGKSHRGADSGSRADVWERPECPQAAADESAL